MQVNMTGSRKLENRLVFPASFQARMTSQATATKCKEELNHLKELCTLMDSTVFGEVALSHITIKHLKEDKPRLIRTHTFTAVILYNVIEQGRLLEKQHLSTKTHSNGGSYWKEGTKSSHYSISFAGKKHTHWCLFQS